MLFISFVLQKFATPSSGGENSLGFNEAKPCKHEFEQHTFLHSRYEIAYAK